jgi:benzoate-CoA ligase family protein
MDPRQIPAQFNAAEHFIDRNVAEGRGVRIAFECGDERLTYAGLLEQVNRAGNAFRELEVRIEERVALILLDTFAFPACFFGAIKIGAVAVPINTLLRPYEWEYILNDTRARVLVIDAELLPRFLEIPREKLRYLKYIVIAGRSAGEAKVLCRDVACEVPTLDTLLEAASPELSAEPTSKDDACFWLYSSGSTGPPKGCVHLQHDMVVCAERYAIQTLGIREDDRCYSAAKLFFAYGLGNAGYFHLAVGATSILFPGPSNAANVFSVIERYRPTLLFSVPTNFAALLAMTREGGDFDLSSVRYGVSAGECLPAAIFERFNQRFGIEIFDAIGSSECLHMFIANRPGAVRGGSSGQIIDGYEARILDESGAPTEAGEIGNLFVRSDATCSMYWNQHERTKDVIQGHWIKTGDKYRVDADGYYWYAGRSDDMLKVSGVWVSPIEIENALIEHPEVMEAAVVGRADGDKLIKPMAFVVVRDHKPGSPQLAKELEDFVASRLAVYKRPRWVEFVNELPKTATGKIQRFRLR